MNQTRTRVNQMRMMVNQMRTRVNQMRMMVNQMRTRVNLDKNQKPRTLLG